jgi:segregation and condensation protein A
VVKVEQLELVFSFPEFEGPLDLLVYLVRKHRVDIRSIPITVIADEFIAHVNKMKSLDMVVTSDFLVMVQFWRCSKACRMSNNEAEVFENQQKELYKSVEEYRALKDLSKEFRVKLYDAYSYERATAKPVVDQKRKEDLPDELTEAFKAILKETVLRERVYTIVSESINVEDRMLQIEQLYETIELYKFLGIRKRSEVIVLFACLHS